MSDSALCEIFDALEAREIRTARQWLESTLFNRRAETMLLFDYLAACRAGNVMAEWNVANQTVFNGAANGLTRLRHEMSALTALLRDFMVWQELLRDSGQKELLLLRAMRKRGLEKNFHLAARDAEKTLQIPGQRAFAHHLTAFRIDMEKYEWDIRVSREQHFSFADLRTNLDAWYAGQLLHLACMEQSRQAIRSHDRKDAEAPDNLSTLLEQLPGRPQESLPGVALYHLGQRMLASPDDSARMDAFRQLLGQQIDTVSPAEARDLLMLAINHGIRRINAGNREALRQTLEFYLLGLEKKLLHDERGVLSKYTYNNVLMSFLALEEWEHAAVFLEQYRPELPAAERDNIYRYNLAIYRFRRGDYDGTLELLREVTFADPMYNLESRKMLLKIYYEQEAFDALDSLLENLLNWLRRHGELGYHREMYRNL
ncbi:MAG TPA: hypothetical protein PK228_12185, partial [Saprospiraceae bacterium]|nr:hypothetical protein [Saprospiraceae bacterium]